MVTIEYRMPSNFGGFHILRTAVHLNVDAERNVWQLDFRGDSDDQDRETITKAMRSETWNAAAGKSNGKGKGNSR